MFKGSLPSKAIQVIGNIVKDWDCDRIIVGCSGNFTIERSISKLVKCPITSNDVTIYSSYLGKYLAGESLDDLKIREDYKGYCGYFEKYMNSDTEKIATLILATDVCEYDFKNHPYFDRMRKAYEEQFPELHAQLCKKLENIKTNIDSFYFGDVMKLIDHLEGNVGFISFPPFFKGGYEKMWHNISQVFTFQEPEYEVFDPNKHIKIFCDKVSKARHFCIGTERKVEELEKYFIGIVQTHQGKNIYFYSKTEKRVYVNKRAQYSKLLIERIKEDDEITNVEVKKISHEIFDELRAKYLSKGIVPARESSAYGLFNQDGKLFGVFGFSTSITLSNFESMISGPTIYMMTDFAVSPTKIKHLSKLVLMCVLSKEVKMLAEHDANKRCRSIVTNAFTKKPVSMKYRGIFEILNKRELEYDEHGKCKKFNITYGAEMGKWTLEEAYEIWKRKFAK